METTPSRTNYYKYTFRNYTGFVVAPWLSDAAHELVTIRHSASEPAWVDPDVHLHSDSEEYYFLFQGELRLLVEGSLFTLKPREALMVKPGVSHAVVGGQGPVKHLGFRMPAPDDRQTTGEIPLEFLPAADEANKYIQFEWGCRFPLTDEWYQNCWLFGFGKARFHSDHMCMVYRNHTTDKSVEVANQNDPSTLHIHQMSWEYYITLKGVMVLQIEDELVAINAGEVLEVPPRARHMLHTVDTPFEGFVFRVPLVDDKVEF